MRVEPLEMGSAYLQKEARELASSLFCHARIQGVGYLQPGQVPSTGLDQSGTPISDPASRPARNFCGL